MTCWFSKKDARLNGPMTSRRLATTQICKWGTDGYRSHLLTPNKSAVYRHIGTQLVTNRLLSTSCTNFLLSASWLAQAFGRKFTKQTEAAPSWRLCRGFGGRTLRRIKLRPKDFRQSLSRAIDWYNNTSNLNVLKSILPPSASLAAGRRHWSGFEQRGKELNGGDVAKWALIGRRPSRDSTVQGGPFIWKPKVEEFNLNIFKFLNEKNQTKII